MAAIAARPFAERLAEWAQFNAEMSRLEADGDDLARGAWPGVELVDR